LVLLLSGELPIEDELPIPEQVLSGRYLRRTQVLLESIAPACRPWIEACVAYSPAQRPTSYDRLRKLLPR